jgi:hypothetical protein
MAALCFAAEGELPTGEQRAVLLIPGNHEENDADGCKGDEDGAKSCSKVTGTSAVTPEAPSQPKDRLLCGSGVLPSYCTKPTVGAGISGVSLIAPNCDS